MRSPRHLPLEPHGIVAGCAVGRCLGAGGMGAVFEGTRPSGEIVALKFPYAETMSDHIAMRRFHDETIVGGIVRHPNLIAVLETGETERGVPYIVMEYVAGDLLAARIARARPSLHRSATIVRQILDGLQALHESDIVHGDVKSDNVILAVQPDGSERAKLIDYGLAHVEGARPHSDDPIAERDLISGTPEYMAPEVAAGGRATIAADVYAAGVILYELVTGTTPFAGGTASEIIQRHITEDVTPPSLRRPDRETPPILERIILHALQKRPGRRFSSAAQFATALGIAMPCLDDVAPSDPATVSTTAPTLDWRPRTGEIAPGRLARGTPPALDSEG